ncbi:hypothetical protein ACFONG_04165 [Uliginosibacterium paludis]|uniref:Uncharacterized protein n=1 Tax=Uliginosibacterium paludis TaxID=1615952 RepID=A0ABV2CNE5_9RHOO
MSRLAFLLLSALLALPAQAAPQPDPVCFLPGRHFDSAFLGNWEIAQWKVRYSLFMRDRQVCLLARDMQADEWFEIPEIQWDGQFLRAGFLLRSTKWRTDSQLSLASGDRLRDEYTWRDGRRIDYWTRRK